MSPMEPIRTSYLNTQAMIDYLEILMRIIEEQFTDDHFTSRQLKALKGLIERANTLNGRVYTNEFTKQLRASDEKRDTLIVALRAGLENTVRLRAIQPAEADAAEQLITVLDANPIEINAGYGTESGQINQLLTNLTTPAMAPLLLTAKALHIVEAIKEEQASFADLYQKKIEADQLKELGSVRAVIKEMDFRLDALMGYLGANAVDLPEQYADVTGKINELTKRVMTAARSSRTRSEAVVTE